VKIKQAI